MLHRLDCKRNEMLCGDQSTDRGSCIVTGVALNPVSFRDEGPVGEENHDVGHPLSPISSSP